MLRPRPHTGYLSARVCMNITAQSVCSTVSLWPRPSRQASTHRIHVLSLMWY